MASGGARRGAGLLAAGALVAATTVVGCSGSVTGTAESALVGTYTLVSVNGAALPAVIDSSPGGPPRKLASGSLAFGGASTYVNVSGTVLVGTDTTPQPYSYIAQYRVSGSGVSIGSFGTCPAGASCIANDVGTWSASQVTVTSGQIFVGGKGATLVFQQ